MARKVKKKPVIKHTRIKNRTKVPATIIPPILGDHHPPGPLSQEIRDTKKREVLDRYIRVKRLDLAAKQSGINPSTPFDWMKADPQFREDYETARKVIGEQCMGLCHKRARKSDILLMFVTKAFVPETRDKTADIYINTEIRAAIGLLNELRGAGPMPLLAAAVTPS